MSENVDLVRSIYADWERGDYSSARWADTGIEADEFRELDAERVLVLDRRSRTLKQSGIEVGASTALPNVGAHLFHIANGKVTRLVMHSRRDRALADLGLE
jgi:hypothetical protein